MEKSLNHAACELKDIKQKIIIKKYFIIIRDSIIKKTNDQYLKNINLLSYTFQIVASKRSYVMHHSKTKWIPYYG